MDEQQRDRTRDDLKGLLKGELLFDELSRALYSTDASIFQVQPAGIVVPRDEEDVQILVRYAAEHKLPLVARGAGTGLAGESLGTGMVVDLSRHFRAILEVGAETVRVQPGVTWRDLNTQLARVGRRFAPDPASGDQCTVGGMIANNASGARALRHGYTRDHVAGLRLVLDTGDAVSVSVEPLHPPTETPTGHLQDIVSTVGFLVEQNAELIRTCCPRTPFNRCGYQLRGLVRDNTLDLPRLLCGSEGTLALITEATLRTIPLPGGRALVLLGFATLEAALRAVMQTLPSQPAACDLVDRRLLTLARGSEASAVAALIPAAAEAVLLVEYEADSPAEARAAAQALVDHLYRDQRLALHAQPAFEQAEIDSLWHLREVALPSLYALRGAGQPVALIEDVGVPVEQLAIYLHRVQEILREHETTASFLIHAGTGQVHTRPFLDLQQPGDVSKLAAIAEEVHTLALDLGGTVSTQHGTGLARTPWVARQYGPLYPVFRQLKAAFDPYGIFNPGKIVGPDPTLPVWPLRKVGPLTTPAADKDVEAPPSPPPLHLRWTLEQVRAEAICCNGCGHCRTEVPEQRMCPVFRATHAEAASPRAKANLLRHLFQDGGVTRLSSNEVRAVADLCVNCKMCALECPAHINIPKLMLEAKAANVAEHGLDRKEWFLARAETFARLGSNFAPLVNPALSSRTIRWVMEKLFGLSRQRRLPRFALRPFLRRAKRRGWTRKKQSDGPRVAYFVDAFANFNDPQIAEAVVAVLQHQDIDIYVPPGQRGCGMAALAHGDIETAREIAETNLRLCAEAAREGYTIVCSEPTAAVMLRQDYPELVDDPDARLVAERTVEFTAFLWDLYSQGKLKTDFQELRLTIGHHVPCHIKALGPLPAAPRLLELIPGLQVRTIDVSCSGMAGTFGLGAENYQTSREAGRPMLEELQHSPVLYGSTECSACRMQMEDGAGKRTLHPAQYLALAYGIMPDVSRRLKERIRDLVLR